MTLEQARARLADYGAMTSRQYPADYPAQSGWAPLVTSLQDNVVGGVSTGMFMLLGGVGLLLLIACVNVAHLVLARAAGRSREMAIRQALGARSGQLIRQLLAESAVIVATSGVLGLIVATWILSGLLALAPGRVPRIDEVTIDRAAVLIVAAIVCVTTVVFGLVPAWHLRRLDTVTAVKDAGAGRSTDSRTGRARNVLVAAEVAMATVLLVGAGLLVRTIVGLMNVPLGFETGSMMTARVTLPRPNDTTRAEYLDPGRRVTFYRETLRRITSLPEVESAAMSSEIPMGGFNPPLFVELQGGAADASVRPVMHSFLVSPSYFATMHVQIVRGRSFNDFDRAGSEPVAIVSEAAARTFWRGRDPIGERIRLAPELPWMTVIGIAGDVLNRRLSEAPQPILYRPLDQASDLTLALLIRSRAASGTLAERIAGEIRAVDPNLPIHSVAMMSDLIGVALAQRQFLMRLLVAFAATATALALLGIYGVMAYSVSQRTLEIGIRMAIGARQVDLSLMVVRHGTALAAAGLVCGVVLSLALSGLVRSQLFGVEPADPITLASVLILMIVVAAAAAYLPARRAAAVDPVEALRAQ